MSAVIFWRCAQKLPLREYGTMPFSLSSLTQLRKETEEEEEYLARQFARPLEILLRSAASTNHEKKSNLRTDTSSGIVRVGRA